MREYEQGETYAAEVAVNYGLANLRAEAQSIAALAETLSTCEAYNYACGMLDEALLLVSLRECKTNAWIARARAERTTP